MMDYRNHTIEPNSYAAVPGMRWQWRPDDDHYDGQPLRFEDTPEACRDAIDLELDGEVIAKRYRYLVIGDERWVKGFTSRAEAAKWAAELSLVGRAVELIDRRRFRDEASARRAKAAQLTEKEAA